MVEREENVGGRFAVVVTLSTLVPSTVHLPCTETSSSTLHVRFLLGPTLKSSTLHFPLGSELEGTNPEKVPSLVMSRSIDRVDISLCIFLCVVEYFVIWCRELYGLFKLLHLSKERARVICSYLHFNEYVT